MSKAVDSPKNNKQSNGWFNRFLATVEFLGNMLPHPITLFALFCVVIVLFSGRCYESQTLALHRCLVDKPCNRQHLKTQ